MPSNNPEYQKAYIRKHYLANKDYYKDKAKKRDEIVVTFNKKVLNRYKLCKGCTDCGYNKHPEALHFDHLNDKTMAVALMLQRAWSLSRIKTEVRKCEVRCANCHAVVTAERRALSS